MNLVSTARVLAIKTMGLAQHAKHDTGAARVIMIVMRTVQIHVTRTVDDVIGVPMRQNGDQSAIIIVLSIVMAAVINTLDCVRLVTCHIMETPVQSHVPKIVAFKAVSRSQETANIAS